ncbi:hypothetical protein CBOM_03850 [Ceraceosorus bombacis]|uniref:Uncharacterized protein n=1 Tax=Ceraceosorus bombacis TaxID=401625 RepID=A0A0P1BIR7_9BASI|nr:hypothetical protein CBOM_03850 [Ceraceosorus bombacis]
MTALAGPPVAIKLDAFAHACQFPEASGGRAPPPFGPTLRIDRKRWTWKGKAGDP